MRLVHVLMAAILLAGLVAPFTATGIRADEVDVNDIPPTGLVQIWLTDAATGGALGGACYLVTDANGIPYSVCDTDMDGFASVGGLAVGEAFVEQTSAPSVDYVGGASGFVVINDGGISDLRLTNALAAVNTADDTQGGAEGEGAEGGDQGTEVEGAEDSDQGSEGEGAEDGDQGTEGEGAEGGDQGTEGEGGDQGTEGEGAEGGDQGTEGEGAEGGDQGTEGEGNVDDGTGITEGTEGEGAVDDGTGIAESDDLPVQLADEEPSFSISCFFSPANGWTLTFTSLVTPTPASHTVTFTPTNRLGIVQSPIVVDSPTTESFPASDWRRIDLVYVYDGTEETGGASCDTSNVTPELTTTPKQQGGATVPLNGSVPVGTQVFDSSVLSNAHVGTGGTVTYSLYKGAACTGTPVFTDTVTVATGPTALTVPDSGLHSITTGEGVYTWQASYTPAGGGANNPAVSTCGAEQFIYGKITPSIVTVMRNGANNVVTPGTGSIQVGDTINDIANLTSEGGFTPTGTVTYQLFSGADCSGAAIETFTNVPVGTATSAVSGLDVGTYRWVATYNGDDQHATAISGCDAEVFSVTPRNPSVTTTPQRYDGTNWINVSNGGTVPLDSQVRDNATLSNVTPNAGGTVTFYLWADPSDCSDLGAASVMGSFSVSGGVLTGTSTSTVINTPGSYRWQARYSGDANNSPAVSPCNNERFVVNRVTTTLTTTMMHSNPASDDRVMPQNDRITTLPATVYDTATLGGATADADGTVTYTLYKGHTCTGTPVHTFEAAVIGGVVQVSSTYTIPALEEGTYNWVASYSGNTRNAPSTSACGSETFHAVRGTGAVTTQVKTEAGANVADGASQEVLQQNRDSALLAGFTPDAGGTVTFFVYQGAGNCTTGGVEVGTVNVVNRVLSGESPLYRYMSVGTYEWQAVYSGDANNAGASSACGSETVVVTLRATTTVTTMHNQDNQQVIADGERTAVPFTTNDSAVINNTLSGVQQLTGTIRYELFNDASCSNRIYDSGNLPIAGGVIPAADNQNITAPGEYNWVVTYSGDEYRATSVSACGSETFYAAATPTLTTSHYDDGSVVAGPVALGSVVHDTATLNGQSSDATGTVTFELWFGAACNGTLVQSFAPVNVAADGTIPASDNFTVDYSGNYYWVARYSGNNTNMPVVSDCNLETFTVSTGTPQITTDMRRGTSAGSQDTVIPQGGYVQTPFFASDRTAIINTPLNITGQISYQLVRGTSAADACTNFEAVGSAQTFPVTDITAIPNADAIQITTPGVYNWIVTFTPDGGGSNIVSGCGSETFVAFAEVERTIQITCTYFPVSKTTSYLVVVPKLTPDAPDYHNPQLVIDAVPLLLDNTTGATITYHNYNSSVGTNNPNALFTRQPWRELRVDVVFPDGVTGWAEADCGGSIKLNPTITTTIENAAGEVIPNGTNLTALPTQVRDTAVLTGATHDFTGTFTYNLYNNAGCTGTPITNVKTVTDPGTAPDSDLFNLTAGGQYRFIVEYSGDANNNPAVSTCQEEFFSINDGPTPIQPTVTGNECVSGVYQGPNVSITNGNGFTYQITSQPTLVGNVWQYTVTATLAGDENIGDVEGTGWVKTGDKTATFNGEIEHNPCIEVLPVQPTFDGNVCENDVYVEPTIILPVDETGVIVYELITAPTSGNNGFYSIRATIDVDGYAWDDDMPEGWTTDGLVATFEGNLPLNLCVEETEPVAPTIDGNTCIAGVFTEPSVVLATAPDHITYAVVSEEIVGDTFFYTVSATITDDHYVFGQLPNGWTLDPNDSSVAIFEGEIEVNECEEVELVAPEVEGNVCEGGEFTEPFVIAPDSNEGLEYEIVSETIGATTFTFTVRATIKVNGFGWATPPGDGWVRIDAVTAEYTETIDLNLCIEVELETPEVEGNVCEGGEFTEPFVVLPLGAEHLQYELIDEGINPNTGQYTYTVRATILADGYGWATPPGDGWTQIDGTTAEYTETIDLNECIPVVPGTPYVEGNTCIGGVFTPPTVSATAVQGIEYQITQPNAGNNWTYTIVATIVDERMGWGDLTNSQFEYEGPLTAIASGTVTPNLCEEIEPVAPTISGNTCIGGVFTPPSVVVATTPAGISYQVTTQPTAGNNWTYTVTATITINGVEWGDLDGWVETSPTTATYTDTIEANECEEIEPVAPTIADNTCIGGVFTPPSVVVATTPAGISYVVTTQPTAGNNWTYTVTATITIDGVEWGDLTGWVETSPTTATYTRTIDANECDEVTPIAPNIDSNVCEGGEFIPPVVVPQVTEGITYVVDQQPTAGNNWTYIVTATIAGPGYAWADLTGTDWVLVSPTEATLTRTIDPNLCIEVEPVNPNVEDNVCEGGVFVSPNVVPVGTEGITYTVVQQPTAGNNWTYIVTAQLATTAYAWGDLSESEWVQNSLTLATLTKTVEPQLCEEIEPVAPTIADNTCIGGVFTPPSVVVATTPAGISYVVTTQPTSDNNWTYTVTATIDIDGVEWGDLTGWVETSPTTATYTAEIDANECEEIEPIVPTIDGNTCIAGVFTPPSVNLPTGPTGISYVLTTAPTAGNNWTYTVTATIDIDGVEWGDLTGWVETSPTTATYTAEIDANECEEIEPVAPTIADNTCTGGVFTPPSVVVATTPAGISYVVTTAPTAGNNWTYTVTATIDIDGVEWGELTGWVETSPTTATYTAEIDANECEEVEPVVPTISGNTCLAGVFTPPSVVTASTPAGVTYVVTTPPTKANGWTYLVTATIVADGIAWGDLTGWTKTSDTTATYTAEIDANECEPIAPAEPQIEDNECVAGVFNPPVVTAGPTPGIRYTFVQPDEENGWQFVVEAEITIDGVEWDDLDGTGWTVISPTVARYEGSVEPHVCEEIAPVMPSVSISTCIAGVFTAPVVTVDDDATGISYAIVQPSKANNWTYTVTATIVENGIGWGGLTGIGWIVTNPTTAVYTAEAEVNECEPVVPLTPVVEGHDCEDGELIPPTVTIGVTPGIKYTIVQPNAGNNWTFTVTAEIEGDGLEWGELTGTGWTIVSPTVATYTFTITLLDCEDDSTPPTPGGPKDPVTDLPNTGAGPISPSQPLMALMAMLAMLALALATRLVRRQDG